MRATSWLFQYHDAALRPMARMAQNTRLMAQLMAQMAQRMAQIMAQNGAALAGVRHSRHSPR